MGIKSENRNSRRLWEEGHAKNDRARAIEAATMPRVIRPAYVPPVANATRAQVRAWMRSNAEDYECATALAEAANAAFSLPGDGLDDETHWVWDEALNAIERAA